MKDFEGNVKDEEDLEEDDDQKDYSESESDSDTIRMSSSASETEVWLNQILFSRFARDLFQVKVEYENMILRDPNVCNLFKETKLRVQRKITDFKSEDSLKDKPILVRYSSLPSDHEY